MNPTPTKAKNRLAVFTGPAQRQYISALTGPKEIIK
jgi:hypothetical protein